MQVLSMYIIITEVCTLGAFHSSLDSEQVICEEGYFLCPDYFYSYCLPKAYICDRNHNCQDGYDEQHCGEGSNTDMLQ